MPRHSLLILLSLSCVFLLGCPSEVPQSNETDEDVQADPDSGTPPKSMGLNIQSEPFGELESGDEVTIWHLGNANGLTVSITDYGGIVTSVKTPDRDGNMENITLGFDNLQGYLDGHPYFGATVGRYANRIAGGKFTLNETEYQLATNNGPNHLHGGEQGFDKRLWTAEEVKEDDRVGLRLTYVSADGEEGYPGELRVKATYWLTNDDELRVDYEAVSTADTVLNLTNHCYWTLHGADGGPILDHVLMLNCDRYLPVDDTGIPTGELKAVKETPMDFTKPTKIGERFETVKGDAENGGYDHCWVINGEAGTMRTAARLSDPDTGRVMEISTDQPGIQFYTGNYLSKDEPGQIGQHHALCLETQHFPDSPNQPEFPSTLLEKGVVFKSTTVHAFSVEK